MLERPAAHDLGRRFAQMAKMHQARADELAQQIDRMEF